MKLLFKTFEFREGVNVTVRNGSKWCVPPGTKLEIAETGKEDDVRRTGTVLIAATLNYGDISQHWLDREHAEEARTLEGLSAAMDRAYGVGAWGPEVTVLFFELD
jgi:hypothetical protein